MKSDNEQSDLPTVTHQNGFSSTMTIGVPTFNSRLIHLFIHLECSRYMFTENICGKHERKQRGQGVLKTPPNGASLYVEVSVARYRDLNVTRTKCFQKLDKDLTN